MRKALAFGCLIAGSACLGVGGTLLGTAILPIEGLFCITLGAAWLLLSEILLDQNNMPKVDTTLDHIIKLLSCAIAQPKEKSYDTFG